MAKQKQQGKRKGEVWGRCQVCDVRGAAVKEIKYTTCTQYVTVGGVVGAAVSVVALTAPVCRKCRHPSEVMQSRAMLRARDGV